WLREHPVEVEWWGGQFASGAVPDGSLLPASVLDAHAVLHGRTPGVAGVPYGSDQRLLTGLGGVPTVVYGPGDVALAHAPDESAPVDEAVQVARTLVLLAARTCGTRVLAPAEALQR
ncbi:MAG TPA: hypothetical protein VNU66_05310, partial [Mycobacteriales bacterium]|nr:hypothetical protein [Mycobacteriales bacterium]